MYEIAQILDHPYEDSAEPLTNPWKGHMDVSLARSLGSTPRPPPSTRPFATENSEQNGDQQSDTATAATHRRSAGDPATGRR